MEEEYSEQAMQHGGPTDELDPRASAPDSEQPTTVQSQASAPATLPHIPLASGRDRCGACGAPLAPDQRYCVQCGQRRGPARVEFAEHLAQAGQQRVVTAAEPARRLPRFSPNAALIAGVGTLMLAMGVGVLIGRAATSEKSASPQVKLITVGGGAATTSGTGTGTAITPSTSEGEAGTGAHSSTGKGSGGGASTATKSGSSSKSSGGKSSSSSSKPKAKVVKVGSHGSGPGYNKKKEFTGNFFGEEGEEG